MSTPEAPLAALLDALNHLGDPARVQAAFTPDAVAYRLGWGERRGQVDERFDGHEEIAAWMRRAPAGTQFSLDAAPTPCEEGITVRYRVTVGEFENRGAWRLQLRDDRVAQLWHQPDDLPGPQPGFHSHR